MNACASSCYRCCCCCCHCLFLLSFCVYVGVWVGAWLVGLVCLCFLDCVGSLVMPISAHPRLLMQLEVAPCSGKCMTGHALLEGPSERKARQLTSRYMPLENIWTGKCPCPWSYSATSYVAGTELQTSSSIPAHISVTEGGFV
jgi:hypothetical protein